MKREKVISVLRFYRDIEKSIKLNERVIKNLEDQYYTTVGAVNMDGMPRGSGGGESPVERAALNIPRSVTNTIESLNRENSRLEKIGAEILSELNRLTYHERAVVLGFYIDGLQWEQISARVNYSPRQCRNIRNDALNRLARLFSQNKAVSRFNFPQK